MDIPLQHIVFHPFTFQVSGEIIALVFLLSVSALVSASETAFFSLTPNDVNTLKKNEDRKSNAVLALLGMQDYLLATILIINNLVNICAVIVANSVIDRLITFSGGALEFGIKVVLVTFLLLLFGEIMPKIFASYNALRFARFISLPLRFLRKMFRPFAWALIRSSSRINETVAVKRIDLSMDELSNALEITTDQTQEEKKILSGIVNFIGTEAVEVMRPRIDVVALDRETSFEAVCRTVILSGFSRIPVYEESIDHIQGVLYVKDLLPHINESDDFDWKKLCRVPYFVPENKKINDLFVEFQTNKIHFAIVVDEYGSTMGVVSLEDILEEIIGEISDESDINESLYTRIDAHTFLFEGKIHLNDFLKILGLDDDYLNEIQGDAETVAGVLIEMKHDFLKAGDNFSYGHLSFCVESVDGLRVDKVKVSVDRKDTAH
ncbi:MAG: gliding motility-associated protein GldE [Rikenellaceae bacterium]|nr:gliding motility-associated protein GldE [Rikenellaceae bacterium]